MQKRPAHNRLFLFASLLRLLQLGKRESALKFFLIFRRNITARIARKDFIPKKNFRFHTLSDHFCRTDNVYAAALQIYDIDREIHLAQRVDDLLIPRVDLFHLQAVPENRMHIFHIDHNGLVVILIIGRGNHLDRMPFEPLSGLAPVNTVKRPLSVLQLPLQPLYLREFAVSFQILFIYVASFSDALHPLGKRTQSALHILKLLFINLDDIVAVVAQIRFQHFMVDIISALRMRRNRDHKRRNRILPEKPRRGDLHRLSERIVIIDGTRLLFVSDMQQRAIFTCAMKQLVADHPFSDIRSDFLYPLVVIQNFMIVFPYHINSRHLKGVQYHLIFFRFQLYPSAPYLFFFFSQPRNCCSRRMQAFRSIGFARCPFIPQLIQYSASSVNASAVMAMIGRSLSVLVSALIRLVAS